MKIGVILTSNDPETAWNALRFAVHCRKQGEAVRVFLTGRGGTRPRTARPARPADAVG